MPNINQQSTSNNTHHTSKKHQHHDPPWPLASIGFTFNGELTALPRAMAHNLRNTASQFF